MLDAADQGFVLCDPGFAPDAMQAALFRRPNVTQLRCPLLGQRPEVGLDAMQITGPLAEQAMAGTLTLASFGQLWRARQGNANYLRGLLKKAELAGRNVRLLCCPAEPEAEIYASVAYRTTLGVDWAAARQHRRFKEALFDPLLSQYGDTRRAGGGRDRMVAESLKNYALLLQLCPELRTLRNRIAALLQA